MSSNPNPILAYCACGKELGFCPTTCRRCLCHPCQHGIPINDCDDCLVYLALRHANTQDALATAFAKGTGREKEEVLDQLRELSRREP